MKTIKMKALFKKSIIGLSFIINFILVFVFFFPVTKYLCMPLIKNDIPFQRQNDVVVILSANGYENGFLDFETYTRLKKGLELYKKGIVDKIICSGGVKFKKIKKSIAECMKNELIFYNVSSKDIFIQDETKNTYNDICGVLEKYKNDFDFNKALFVTSAYHTLRVKKILEKQKKDARVISADPYYLYPKIWVERLEFLWVIAREYMALVYFKIRGYL